MYIDVIELACPVRTRKVLVSSFFCKFMDFAAIKLLLSWSLYFEFPDGTAHLISETRVLSQDDKNLFLLRHFCRTSAKILGQRTRKRFLLNTEMFPF